MLFSRLAKFLFLSDDYAQAEVYAFAARIWGRTAISTPADSSLIRALQSYMPDAVFVDIDGHRTSEIVGTIMRHARAPRPMVGAITGALTSAPTDQAEKGYDYICSKPLDESNLTEVFERVIRRRAAANDW